jgi:uncharacterized membrane protein
MRRPLHHRPLLWEAAAAGLPAGLFAAALGQPAARAVLVGWCLAAALWLALMLRLMLRMSPEAIRQRAEALDENKWVLLGASVGAALAALAAVVWNLAEAGKPPAALAVVLGLLSILLSWSFVHVLFAVRYAHQHWMDGRGIVFPGCERPDFIEFLYFACTIGMTFQVSDCTTETPAIRRLALLHGILSFLFNAVILAAAVNLAAGLAG